MLTPKAELSTTSKFSVCLMYRKLDTIEADNLKKPMGTKATK